MESDDDDDEVAPAQFVPAPEFVAEIYPINKPPANRKREAASSTSAAPAASNGKASSSASKRRSSSKAAKLVTEEGGGNGKEDGADGSHEGGKSGGKRSNHSRVERPMGDKPSELLDSRNMPDADELYTENERALTQFIKLHPMLRCACPCSARATHVHAPPSPTVLRADSRTLSLEATSERTLSKAAALVDRYAMPTKELETVTKAHDDLFFRRAKPDLGERPCVNGDKCICRWLAIFRYGEETDAAFVCREFLLPSQLDDFQKTGRTPKVQGKCLLCTRYFTSYVYTLARNVPDFCPKSCIAIQTFGNAIECANPEDEAATHANAVGGADGYRADVMLYVDEKWANTSASRGAFGTLLWRPIVRFNSSDYVFVKSGDGDVGDVGDGGGWRVIQRNLGVTDTSGQDFGQPPFSPTEEAEAAHDSLQRSTASECE